jgi:hypothetical protein
MSLLRLLVSLWAILPTFRRYVLSPCSGSILLSKGGGGGISDMVGTGSSGVLDEDNCADCLLQGPGMH